MSLSQQVNIACHSCGHLQTMLLWLSINVLQHPALKMQLLQHTLHRKVCEQCGKTNTITRSLLYHDPEHPSMIWLSPQGESPAEQVSSLMDHLPVDIVQQYTFRTVKDLNALIEKIRCFDDALDDRVLEIVKLLLLQQWLKQHPDEQTAPQIYYTDTSEDAIRTRLHFAIFNTDKADSSSISIPRYIYDGVLSDFRSHLRNTPPWQLVDMEYAAQLFQRFHKTTDVGG